MNVVIAIDSFKGSMTSLEAGESASAGIRRIYPDADIAIRPLADGGEGTVDALTLGCGGTRTQVCVTGPLENRCFAVTAFWMLAKLQSSKCPELPELHSFPKPNGILCIQQPTGLGKSSETPFPEAADILL